MSGSSLLDLLDLFDSHGIVVWLDGGWAVDAVLGRQTRVHKDVDIEIVLEDVPKLQKLLAPRGFIVREGHVPHSFVLENADGLAVDVHAMKLNDRGDGIYRMENGQDWTFTREGLNGHGMIEGRSVKCLTPEYQVECHAYGYVPTAKDFQDMRLIAEKFGLTLPDGLRP